MTPGGLTRRPAASQDGDHSRGEFDIEARRPSSEVVLLSVKGEVDLHTSLPLKESLVAALAERPRLIAVDLTGVRFMDATGLGVLAGAARLGGEGQARFIVICPSGHRVARLLQLTGLHRVLEVHESADEALQPWLTGEAGATADDHQRGGWGSPPGRPTDDG